jgi:hemerythrin
MDQIIWHDTYALGFEPLDDDHRGLFDILNKIIVALQSDDWETCRQLAKNFVLALRRHYPREEQFLNKIGYSKLEQHAVHHRQMLVRAEKFVAQFDKAPDRDLLERSLQDIISSLLDDVRGGDLNFRTDLLKKGLDKALAERSLLSIWL